MTWYSGDATYDTVLALALGFAALVGAAACFLPSPYGRFGSPRFGIGLSPRLGWFLMELPATVSFLYFYARGPHRGDAVPLVVLGVWLVHYGNRGFVFPYLIRVPPGARGSFSVVTVVLGWMATAVHGYLAARWVATFAAYPASWLRDPRFLGGLALYGLSLGLNLQSDAILRNLRTRAEVAAGEKVYRIPRGGLFEYVTSPSYLAELGCWAGFALFTWSLAGVYIFALSAANLVPRAIATHRWYLERFPDYPRDRRVLVPFVY